MMKNYWLRKREFFLNWNNQTIKNRKNIYYFNIIWYTYWENDRRKYTLIVVNIFGFDARIPPLDERGRVHFVIKTTRYVG